MKWISVKDQLPDEDVCVLVLFKRMNLIGCGFQDYTNISEGMFDRGIGWEVAPSQKSFKVIAWMERPEDIEGETKEIKSE